MEFDPNLIAQLSEGLAKFLKENPEIYKDILQPVSQETGKLLGRIPRAINAALLPLDAWILNREYNYAAVKHLLADKLKAENPQEIVTPEPYVAVPALQALSYSMDNEDLRDMYASLLAKAMVVGTKDCVHPAFVNVIKQLAPRDASNLHCFEQCNTLPIARYFNNAAFPATEIEYENVFLENKMYQDVQRQSVSLSSLERLGLIKLDYSFKLSDENYDCFSKTEEFHEILHRYDNQYPMGENIAKIQKGIAALTPFGSEFLSVCIE